jgi:glycosyltransferase involved in cell wall biosynthesis
MKNTLFLSCEDYDFDKTNAQRAKKWTQLGRRVNAHVLGRGKSWKIDRYGCVFYLVPKVAGPLWFIPWTVIVLFRGLALIRKHKIDVIVCQSPLVDGFLGALLRLLTKRQLIVGIHGDWIESPFLYHDLPAKNLLRQIFIALGKFSLGRADKIRIISESTRNLAEKYARGQPLYKFPSFMVLDEMDVNEQITIEKKIVFVGWLYRLKGIQYLIQAFAALQRKYPDYVLVIAGDGPYSTDLKRLVQEMSVTNVIFAGRLSPEEVRNEIRTCLCVVLPSLSEGLGRVLIEAAMMRKACIGSNIDGIPEVIKHNETGLLFEPADVVDLERQLGYLMSNPAIARSMGERGRASVEAAYSEKHYLDSYVAMISG